MQAVLNWLLLINIQTAGGSSWSKRHTQHCWQISDLQGPKQLRIITQHYITSELIIIHFQLDRKRVQWNIKKYESIQYSKKEIKKKLQRQQKCAEQLHKDEHALEVFHHLLQL